MEEQKDPLIKKLEVNIRFAHGETEAHGSYIFLIVTKLFKAERAEMGAGFSDFLEPKTLQGPMLVLIWGSLSC